MKVYHCSKSRSVRVLWMLEELGLEYELETIPFGPEGLQSTDYLAVNPFGKVPVLVDGAVTMSESVAIIQYLLDRYADGQLQPDPDSPEYGRFLQWMHFGESTMMGPVATIARYTIFLRDGQAKDEHALAAARKTLNHYCEVLDKELASREYLVDNQFTAADIVVGYSVFVTRLFRAFPEGHSNLDAWYQRLEARPAFQKAVAA